MIWRLPAMIHEYVCYRTFSDFWQISQRKTNNKIGSAPLFLTVGFSFASTSLPSTWQTINPNSRLISRQLAEKLVNVCICALLNVSPSISWDYSEAIICLTNDICICICIYYICIYGYKWYLYLYLYLLHMHIRILQFYVHFEPTGLGQLKHTDYCPTLPNAHFWAKIPY